MYKVNSKKFYIKKIIILIVAFFTILFSGCGIFRKMKDGLNSSIALAEDFCIAISMDNYDLAKEYIHKDATNGVANLKNFVSDLELSYGVKYANGVNFSRVISANSTYLDSVYNGSVYEFTYEMTVGTKKITMFFVVVDNDADFGIYSFGIES